MEKSEPTDAGGDLIAGSLTKNPGGGLHLPVVIYVVKAFVEAAAGRVIAPGLGTLTGPMLESPRQFSRGCLLRPCCSRGS